MSCSAGASTRPRPRRDHCPGRNQSRKALATQIMELQLSMYSSNEHDGHVHTQTSVDITLLAEAFGGIPDSL